MTTGKFIYEAKKTSIVSAIDVEDYSENRLLEDLKNLKKDSEPSKLLQDLEEKRKINSMLLGVSQLVKDLEDKKKLEELLLIQWKQASNSSKEEVENLILETLGHPLEISKLIEDLEQKKLLEEVELD